MPLQYLAEEVAAPAGLRALPSAAAFNASSTLGDENVDHVAGPEVVQPLRPTTAMRSLALASIASLFGPGAVWRVVRALISLGRATFPQLLLAVRTQHASRLAQLPAISPELVRRHSVRPVASPLPVTLLAGLRELLA